MAFRTKPLIVCFSAGLGLTVALFPPSFFPGEVAGTAGFVLFILSLWATGLLPEYLTALIFFTGAMILALVPPHVVFSGFTSRAFWLVLGGLVLGVGIQVTGLGSRLAARVAGRLNRSYAGLIFGLVFCGVLFAMVMPSSIGRVVLLVPIAMLVAREVGFEKHQNGYTGVVSAVILGTVLSGFAILPANVANMVLAGLSETLHGYSPLYGEYLLLHLPVLGLVKLVALGICIIFIFPDTLKKTGKMTMAEGGKAGTKEKVLGILLILMLCMWATDSLHHISPAWVAMAGACIVLLPGVAIVGGKAFQEKINFGSLFYIAGILGLGQLIGSSGLGTVLAERCISALPLNPAHPFFNFLGLSILSLFTGVFTTQPGIPALLTPFADQLAQATGFSVKTVLMLQVLGFSQPLFPYQVPPLLIGMQMASIPLSSGFKLCLWLTAISILLLFPLNYLWWRFLGWI